MPLLPFSCHVLYAYYIINACRNLYLFQKAFGADECIAWAHVMLPQAIFSGETIDDYYPLSGQQASFG